MAVAFARDPALRTLDGDGKEGIEDFQTDPTQADEWRMPPFGGVGWVTSGSGTVGVARHSVEDVTAEWALAGQIRVVEVACRFVCHPKLLHHTS